jgi:hypothetical protein
MNLDISLLPVFIPSLSKAIANEILVFFCSYRLLKKVFAKKGRKEERKEGRREGRKDTWKAAGIEWLRTLHSIFPLLFPTYFI